MVMMMGVDNDGDDDDGDDDGDGDDDSDDDGALHVVKPFEYFHPDGTFLENTRRTRAT